MVGGLDASQKHRKRQAQPPIPAFSNTSQHKGILEEQRLFAFFKADYGATIGAGSGDPEGRKKRSSNSPVHNPSAAWGCRRMISPNFSGGVSSITVQTEFRRTWAPGNFSCCHSATGRITYR